MRRPVMIVWKDGEVTDQLTDLEAWSRLLWSQPERDRWGILKVLVGP